MRRKLFVSEGLEDALKDRVQKELKLGYINLEDSMFEQAKQNFEIVLEYDSDCADAYWGLMLVKYQISNEKQLRSEPLKYKTVPYMPECQKALELASDQQKRQYKDLLETIYQINQGDNY
ncbi:MAG: hypothetical protein E7375_00485 [Clostridiales bacterium]|nr:hypothetical protein [Clostridiales bacterium]